MVQIYVERNPEPHPSNIGDWVVRIGRGQGGKFYREGGSIRTYHKKKAALKRARKEARKRADDGQRVTLYAHKKRGRPKKKAEYNGGHKGKSIFSGIPLF